MLQTEQISHRPLSCPGLGTQLKAEGCRPSHTLLIPEDRASFGQSDGTAAEYTCDTHGKPTKRATCRKCNAAYQRGYLKRRREEAPAKEMWHRAKERARKLGIAFEIPNTLVIPNLCPVLGADLTTGDRRSATSPSLDRIDPSLGYVPGNVRVISDRANRLKSNRSLEHLKALAISGPRELRADYARVAAYLDRELLLKMVRRRGELEDAAGTDWVEIGNFLEKKFADFGPRLRVTVARPTKFSAN